MGTYRSALPQRNGGLFLSDGGLETTLVFKEGLDLPCFAAFPLLETEEGRDHLRRYFAPYLQLASRAGAGFVLDTATWRANLDWGAKLGFDRARLADVNRAAARFAADLRDSMPTGGPVVISGVIGPRGDGYVAGQEMDVVEAQSYHAFQAAVFAEGPADFVSAITMTNVPEAIGIARAARDAGMPVVISFTVETDGRLPSGAGLEEAVDRVDQATGGYPAYFMINCAHPTHFMDTLQKGAAWVDRIGGVRANASARSHAELDAATELDEGDPETLAQQYVALRRILRQANVLGGCCGTDHRHVGAICTHAHPTAHAA